MAKRINFKTGQMVGESGLPYISDGDKAGGRRTINTVCKCGKEFNTRLNSLMAKSPVKSCGCNHRVNLNKAITSHGMTNTVLYKRWTGIKSRCNNPNEINYRNYGGRGIFICDEWASDFMCFYEWAISNGYDESLQIDRINNSDGYHPENCRFITSSKNSRNRRVKSNNKWGISGVSFCKTYNKFLVEITISKGKKKNLKSTSDFFEACCSRKSAENRFWV